MALGNSSCCDSPVLNSVVTDAVTKASGVPSILSVTVSRVLAVASNDDSTLASSVTSWALVVDVAFAGCFDVYIGVLQK